ncbi:2-oxoglutarate dehydrogenase E1 component [Coemansia sp. RSA 989]|nr:oxoglutarate dehydrogenase, E1 component [Coemansia mojavensis]KAJ1744110.1 2-oxoglutarate dehydrogenase E1 component [Coemansia sp. RSA 1086]KAJ1867813.1 2-oxoglutarate dehydrogenase E1 component [Coemansia sp. RSA 989]KAJ1874699.1 2-oxoglutarate dehydrogenase E1 component [Coemansia sp. RSA 990]KAJ2673694.1 2-oxoglutarate dehydrogenase E1 component [Coemansia sp. RSA 1085]
MASLLRAARSQVLRSRIAMPALASRRAGMHAALVAARTKSTASTVTGEPHPSESFLSGNVTPYIEQMYEAYIHDPNSVHASWRAYFKNVDSGMKPGQAFQSAPNLIAATAINPASDTASHLSRLQGSPEIVDHLKVQLMARAYQVRGHHLAKLDPLEIQLPMLESGSVNELNPSYYGFTEKDMDRKFTLGPGVLQNFAKAGKAEMSLREIVQTLESVYCGSIGVEYTHIADRGQCDWIRERFEVPQRFSYTKEQKFRILDRLIWGSSFEKFASTKWPSQKRFGLEGCEALIPGMKELIDHAVDLGVESIVMGMAHRGRLNVLSNVVRKPNESIFCEFSGELEPTNEGSGDAKYHLGMNFDRPTPNGKRVHLSLLANPSHLEATDPVVLGKTRALQMYTNDTERTHTMPLLLHGDAAFAAQGVVYETLGFSDLPGYTTGGTVHVIINNQIGFTTDPRFARSTLHPSEISKSISAPIVHVNADDVEAVVFAFSFAAEWRQKFHTDIVLNLVGYRRHGHNEADQPSFTQPLMYKRIKQQRPVLDKYTEQLVAEGTFTREEIAASKERVWNMLDESYRNSKDYTPSSTEWLSSAWPGFKSLAELATEITPAYPTGITSEIVQHVGKFITSVPSDFNAHPLLKRVFRSRAEALDSGKGIDWATAEALAFGSLLLEGKHVRLSGQDCERGTFSHRHAVLHDQDNERQYTQLANLSPTQAPFSVSNSSLSEYGVLGYELGYSLANPNSLVMWEAQFGDFANTAQVIIDQFIAAGEKKWLQRSGLTMLLPHGFDGQGSEHSSARLERYLQLCDEHPYVFPSEEKLARQHQDCNMQVVYPTTPANYFHVLRRQIYRDYRKPLVVMTSKKQLRFPLCRSDLSELTGHSFFQRYIPEPHPAEGEFSLVAPENIRTHILCSGQVYYALLQARELNNVRDVAISRVEQLHPFPWDLVRDHIEKYPNCEFVWCQEEPLNMGSWAHVEPRLRTIFNHTENHKGKAVRYAGRDPSGPVATGNHKQHVFEEWSLISQALFGEARKPSDIVSGVPKWD